MAKILIVSDYLDKLGGIENYIFDLKKILEKEGHQVEIFGGKKINKFIGLIISFYNKKYAKKLRKKVKEFQPNIIWFHSVSRFLGAEVIKEGIKPNIASIMTYHDLGYFAPFASKIRKESEIPNNFSLKSFLKANSNPILLPYVFLKYFKLKKIRFYLQKVNYHTIPSNFMKKFLIQQNYANEESIKVLPNFILKEKITTRENILQDKINFIFFGRLEAEKGIKQILFFLGKIWKLKYQNKDKFKDITKKIRIFIFGDGNEKKELLNTFIGKDLYGKDISFVKDLSNKENITNIKEFIDKDNTFVYFFGKRDFKDIKKYLSFCHFNLVPSTFLETFGLSAAEACANKLVNIGFDKQNITNFLLEEYKIKYDFPLKNFSNKMFNIIENFSLEKWKENSNQSFKLVKELVIN